MKVQIESQDRPGRSVIIESHPLHHDQQENRFWMRLAMGDDFFQRVTSDLTSPPLAISWGDNTARVAFARQDEALQFEEWLYRANRVVTEAYRTMRG